MINQKSEILIAEDDVHLASNLRDVLETIGYHARVAHDGQSAMDICCEDVPDLALVDIKLPDMLGVNLVRDLAKAKPDIQAILMTGHASLETALDAFSQKSIVAYETKPLDMDHLLSVITNITARKRAENALRDSEEKFSKSFHSNAALMAIISIEYGRFIDANDALLKTFEYTRNELLEKTFDDLGLFFDDNQKDSITHSFKSQKSARDLEVMICTRSGNVRHGLLSGDVIRLKDEICWLVVFQDVTERKQTEEALTRITKAIESSNEAIGISDAQGNHFYQNRAFTELFGYNAKELASQGGGPIVYANNKVANQVFDTIMSGKSWTGEIEMLSKSGSTFPVSLRADAIKDDSGEIIGLIGIHTDISERKEAEEQILQRNMELAALNEIAQTISQSVDLRVILNNTTDKILEILNINICAIYFADKDTNNLSLEIHRGISDEEAKGVASIETGKGLLGLVAQSGEPSFIDCLTDYAELIDDGAQRIVLEHQLKSAIFVPLNATGNVLGVIGAFTHGERIFTKNERNLLLTIGHQIGTAIENSQLLEKASRARALEELDTLRSALLASVSHELRTPLAAIKGLSSTLIQPDVIWDPETQHDFLKTIDHESDILTHIVDDLMQMSQLEAGVMRIFKAPTRVSTIISQIGDQLQHQVINHRLEISIQPNLPPVVTDSVRIGQVIVNLVSNATQYSEPGTRITLEGKQINDEIVVSVSDEGIGISNGHLNMVFDKFYRLESGVARRRGGTGLGLAICKGIIEGHSGKIWVESKLNKGSIFSFSLPIQSRSPKKRSRTLPIA